MMRHLRGVVLLELTGASPEACFSRWAREDLAFWEPCRRSDLVFTCKAWYSQLSALQRAAERTQCRLRVLSQTGAPVLLQKMRNRPVMSIGLPFVVLLAMLLQSFVWFIRLEGNEKVSDERILQELWEQGVRFGAWGPDLDPVQINSRMLNRIPELSWITINRSGGVVAVSCAERAPAEQKLETEGIADLTAVRSGLIRELHVINGFPQVKVGDLVFPGDVLVSGTMEWTTHIQATRAMGEVYADTLRTVQLVCPAASLEKSYTGREEICRTLIFQRKRRKISGNSSIFGTSCDRMVKTEVWSLPGGYFLPFAIETEILREYTLTPSQLPGEAAAELLNAESRRLIEGDLIAGSIETGTTLIQNTNDSYLCRASMNCLELISRSVPVELFREEEENGETDQRGTD